MKVKKNIGTPDSPIWEEHDIFKDYKGTGQNSFNSGTNTTASGKASHAEGSNTKASGECSHAEGSNTKASDECSHAEGSNTKASGECSHAEGYGTEASGHYSHAEGGNTEALYTCSHAEGNNTKASGECSHAEGYRTEASELCSHAEGAGTEASGYYSHAGGNYTTATPYASMARGQYNKTMTGNASTYSGKADAFVIGNGTSKTVLGNAFRVTFDGKVYGLSAYNSTGADYSEYFEWMDGNVDGEDRVGYFVTLDGGQIRKATSEDEYILGIVSATPSIVGDSYDDDWKYKYVTDDWGRVQFHEVEKPAKEDEPARISYEPIYNPDWDSSKEYEPRSTRKEWSAVGLIGKLLVRDDGTAEVNGYVMSNDDGIAMKTVKGFRVIRRVTENIVEIIVK